MKKYRLAILQRVIPAYRQSLFEGISTLSNIELKLFYGSDVPNTKIKSSFNKKKKFESIKLKTSIIKIFKTHLIWHHNLFSSLKHFCPDLIISEGESNILSYIQAIFYKLTNKNTKIIHWSLGGIPKQKKSFFFKRIIKFYLLKCFDSYIVYSNFGKEYLIKTYNINPNKIFTALNISNIDKIIKYKDAFDKNFNKISNDIDDFDNYKFTLITSGNLEKNKNFELILKAFKYLPNNKFNLIFLGRGKYKKSLINLSKDLKLKNIYFLGHVNWEKMIQYYSYSDLFVLPGRGGMVITESMACGLPVILYAADGTEFDFIEKNATGFFFEKNDPKELANKILFIYKNKKLLKQVSLNAYNLIRENYSNDKFIKAFEKAIMNTLNE